MKIAIVKYNAGNVFSVECALRRLGVEPVLTADPDVLRAADKVFFLVWEKRRRQWLVCVAAALTA